MMENTARFFLLSFQFGRARSFIGIQIRFMRAMLFPFFQIQMMTKECASATNCQGDPDSAPQEGIGLTSVFMRLLCISSNLQCYINWAIAPMNSIMPFATRSSLSLSSQQASFFSARVTLSEKSRASSLYCGDIFASNGQTNFVTTKLGKASVALLWNM